MADIAVHGGPLGFNQVALVHEVQVSPADSNPQALGLFTGESLEVPVNQPCLHTPDDHCPGLALVMAVFSIAGLSIDHRGVSRERPRERFFGLPVFLSMAMSITVKAQAGDEHHGLITFDYGHSPERIARFPHEDANVAV